MLYIVFNMEDIFKYTTGSSSIPETIEVTKFKDNSITICIESEIDFASIDLPKEEIIKLRDALNRINYE